MKVSYVLTENAQSDVIEAALWEEARHVGLGEKLLDCIDETIDQICKSPLGYVNRYKNTRERKVKKFAYQIIYTVENNLIYIHAVFACKQDPGKKYKKL